MEFEDFAVEIMSEEVNIVFAVELIFDFGFRIADNTDVPDEVATSISIYF